jgi:hypothetical protein
MAAEDPKILKIKIAFLQYAKKNELSAFSTPYYLAKQILPEESLFLKMEIIQNLIDAGIIKIIKDKWIITNTGYQSL